MPQQDIRCLIVLDSICKYINHIPGTTLYCVRGADIAGLGFSILQSGIDLKQYKIIIVHVGTNNVRHSDIPHIRCLYNALIFQLHKANSGALILLSSVLHRPVDFQLTKDTVIKTNQCLKFLAQKYLYCEYLKTYKSFMSGGAPNRSLYATNDGGLHLNVKGTLRLRSLFKNRIVLKSKLYT